MPDSRGTSDIIQPPRVTEILQERLGCNQSTAQRRGFKTLKPQKPNFLSMLREANATTKMCSVHVSGGHVNPGPTRPHRIHNPSPPLLCTQFDSQWDAHPDNKDQCCFIKPTVKWGGGKGLHLQPVLTLLHGGPRGCAFFSREKAEKSILRRAWTQ